MGFLNRSLKKLRRSRVAPGAQRQPFSLRELRLSGDPTIPGGTRPDADALFIDQSIPIHWLSDWVAVPTEWVPELRDVESGHPGAIQAIVRVLDLMAVPWIISSMSRALDGSVRKSESHLNHSAIDVAPMESSDVIIGSTDHFVNIAMRWDFLGVLHEAFSTTEDVTPIAEGDHVHVILSTRPAQYPAQYLLAYTSVPAPYSTYRGIPELAEVENRALLFDATTQSVLGPNGCPNPAGLLTRVLDLTSEGPADGSEGQSNHY